MAIDQVQGAPLSPDLAATLVEAVAGAAWATDATGRFTYVTSSAPAFQGLTPADLNAEPEPRGWRRLIHPEDAESAALVWRQALLSGAPYRASHRTLSAGGGYSWSHVAGQPLHDGAGHIVGWYGALTEDAAPASDAAPSDRGLPDMASVHPHDRATVVQASSRAFFHDVPQVSSYRELQTDGSYRWVELRVEAGRAARVDPGVAIARQDDAWSTVEELGETIEAVEIARRLENLYGGAWALDARGLFTYATPTAQTSIGLTLESLNESLDGRAFIDGGEHGWKRTVHPDDYDEMAAGFRNGLRRGEAWNVEYRVLRANGDYVWHRVGARPTFDAHGRVTGWYGISLDIDVYRKTEAALRESEQRLRQLIDAVPALMLALTPDGQPSYVNKRWVDVVGLGVEGLLRPDGIRSLADIHPDQQVAVEAALRHSLSTGEPFLMRFRQRRVDGQYRWTDGRVEAHRDEAGAIVQWYGVCFDVDREVQAQEHLRIAQERLAQASQAAGLAELSASIAHEVNQPLAAVVANSHAGLRWLMADPPNLDRAKSTVERIIRDANAAADVVSRVRALFKQDAARQTRLSLAPVIAEARRLLVDAAVAQGVSIETELEAGLPLVVGDPLQLQQILVNLMRNGIEAMAAGAGQALRVAARRDGAVARVEVVDQGAGIPAPERVFDPFFTTKASGMGMGLAISRSIVESHGGRLWVETPEGGGARFVFTLPLAADTA